MIKVKRENDPKKIPDWALETMLGKEEADRVRRAKARDRFVAFIAVDLVVGWVILIALRLMGKL